MNRPTLDRPDLAEHGARGQTSDRRLFVQFLAFGRCTDPNAAAARLQHAGLEAALYLDVNDPAGVGLAVLAEDPATFTDRLRPVLLEPPFDAMALKHHFTMLGRTYSLGYEPDLRDTLLERPRRHILQPDWPWVIWYPLRRSGAFERLTRSTGRLEDGSGSSASPPTSPGCPCPLADPPGGVPLVPPR